MPYRNRSKLRQINILILVLGTMMGHGMLSSAIAATVAHWRFEGTGVTFLADSSGNGHNLTYSASTGTMPAVSYVLPTTGAGSAFSDPIPQSGLANAGAAQFTAAGVNGFLGAADSAAWTTNTFTLEAMLNLGASNTLQSIAGQLSGTESATRTLLFHVNSSNALSVIINNSTINSTLTLAQGVDYFVAVAVDLTLPQNQRVTFYLQDLTNGGALQTQTTASTSTNILDNPSAFSIGSTGSPSSRFTGLIDEVRFSNTALSANQLLVAPEPGRALLICLGVMFAGLIRRRRR